MKERALICNRHPVNTEGLRKVRSSRKYDVLKVIGTGDDVDLSQYSEIILHYQSNIDVIDSVFIDFVNRNRTQLKNATLLFDIPMEIIDDIGMEKSIEYMRSISRGVFDGEEIPFYIHSNPNMPIQADRFSELGVESDNNRYWAKESGHVSVLAQYYLDEMHRIPRHSLPYMAAGILLIIIGAVLSILSYFKIVANDVAIYSLIIVLGISVLSAAYLSVIWHHWKE